MIIRGCYTARKTLKHEGKEGRKAIGETGEFRPRSSNHRGTGKSLIQLPNYSIPFPPLTLFLCVSKISVWTATKSFSRKPKAPVPPPDRLSGCVRRSQD